MREEGDHVVFLHRLAPGSADQSYGINVAQMAGMPAQVVARAQEILARLEKDQIDTKDIHSPDAPPPVPRPQLDLFPAPADAPWVAELRDMDLSQITPLQALLKLNEWKEKIKNGE